MNTPKTPSLPVWARIVLVFVAYAVLSAFFILIGFLIAGIPLDDPVFLEKKNIEQTTIVQLFSLLPTIIVVFVFRKYLDLRSIKSLGFSFKGIGCESILGLFVAILITGVGSLLLFAFGNITISNLTTDSSNIVMGFVLFIMVSLNEELLFRGYILNNLLTATNRFVALLISSVLFALLHSFNSNLTLLSLFNLFLAGILLGSTYIYTQNLWFPLSLHLFWNFIQGPILGYGVSGRKIESMFATHPKGNEFISGGQFGFEGSVICTVLSIVAIALIIWWQEKKVKTSEKRKLGNLALN